MFRRFGGINRDQTDVLNHQLQTALHSKQTVVTKMKSIFIIALFVLVSVAAAQYFGGHGFGGHGIGRGGFGHFGGHRGGYSGMFIKL